MTNVHAFDELETRALALEQANRRLSPMAPEERIAWASEHLPSTHVMSSSFGAQAAITLHMVTRQSPDIPVVLIDTGYLFPETYRFVDELTEKLSLNLKVFRSDVSPAWQEARHGQRWQNGKEGLQDYNRENKVEPMEKALEALDAGTWFSGIRRTQSEERRNMDIVEMAGDVWKVHPILEWTDRDVHMYLKRHGLPYHPLWEHGYLSIGDTHSTKSLHEVSDASELRFFGISRECGLHDEVDVQRSA